MMNRLITAINVQRRNPDRVNIDLDGEFGFGLSRLVAAWLTIGDRLDDPRIVSLLERDALEVACQRAIAFLNHRARTEKEIRQKLMEKGFTEEQIDQTVEKLKTGGLIQDEEYARLWVENRNQSHPRGQRLIKMELNRKGIDDVTIENALQFSAGDEELAYRAAVQYARRLRGLDYATFQKRLVGYLSRRGFTYTTIKPVVKTLWEAEMLLQGELGE